MRIKRVNEMNSYQELKDKVDNIYRDYDAGEFEDTDAMAMIYDLLKSEFGESDEIKSLIEKGWETYDENPSSDALLDAMEFVKNL